MFSQHLKTMLFLVPGRNGKTKIGYIDTDDLFKSKSKKNRERDYDDRDYSDRDYDRGYGRRDRDGYRDRERRRDRDR